MSWDWDSRNSTELDDQVLESIANWSQWERIGDALEIAPRSPGVYIAREGLDGPVVYVGMAGERNGKGIRGRLGVYLSGKALASGLGEAVFDRALADIGWLSARLNEVEAGEPLRAKQWGQAAFERADLYLCWSTTPDRASALALERACMEALLGRSLWNRRLPSTPEDDSTIVMALDSVTPQQWTQLEAATDALTDMLGPPVIWASPDPLAESADDTGRLVRQFTYPDYADEVTAVIERLYKSGLIVSFDWQSWVAAQPASSGISGSDQVTAVKYLTAVVRGERFSDGTIAAAIDSGQFAEALRALQRNSPTVRDTGRMQISETFDPELLARLRTVLDEGDVVPTLGQGRPNVIGRISDAGIEVATEKSAQEGKTRLVPAWMFNHVWTQLLTHGRVDRDFADRFAPGRKVKRSSAVFAILERLPEVSVIQDRPLVLGLGT